MKGLLFLVATAVALSACAQPGAPPVCTAPLKPAVAIDLYFGRDKPAGGEVTDAEWGAFVAEVVTSRFPDGVSIFDASGQYREPSGRIVRERSKRLVVVVFDSPAHRGKLDEIVDTYKRRFGQYSVFRVEQPVCAGL
jgi:Protein of unknown function (DUF3574)